MQTEVTIGTRSWGSAVAAAVAVTLALWASPAEASRLRKIWTGTSVMSVADGATKIVNIDAVETLNDTSKAFLVFGVKGSDTEPADIQVSGQISSASQITFQRVGAVAPTLPSFTDVTIVWYVAEFEAGVRVIRGSTNLNSSATATVAIPSVDLSKSFPIHSIRVDGGTFGDNDLVSARLTSATTLELSAGSAGGPLMVEWQVVEYQGATVSTGSTTFAAADAQKTVASTAVVPSIASINPAKTWLIYSHYITTKGTHSGIADKLIRGRVSGSNFVFDRDLSLVPMAQTASAQTLNFSVVQFTDLTTVDQDIIDVNGALTGARTFTKVGGADPTRALVFGGYMGRSGRTSWATDDDPGHGWFTYKFTSAGDMVTVTAERGANAGSSSSAPYTLLQFATSATDAKVSGFRAETRADGVRFAWRTGHELDNLGFRVWREQRGSRAPLGDFVSGSLFLAGPGAVLPAGRGYDLLAPDAVGGGRYLLEAVGLDGKSTWIGPVAAESPRRSNPVYDGLLQASGRGEALLTGGDLRRVPLALTPAARPVAWPAADLPLAGDERLHREILERGPAIRIGIRTDGVTSVDLEALRAAGFPIDAATPGLQLWTGGREVPLLVSSPGNPAAISFYGVGADTDATDERAYWLVAGSKDGAGGKDDSAGQRAGTKVTTPGAAGGTPVEDQLVVVERRDRTRFVPTILNGAASNFFGSVVGPTGQVAVVERLPVAGLVGPGDGILGVRLQGGSDAVHKIAVALGDALMGYVQMTGRVPAEARFKLPAGTLTDGEVAIRLSAEGGSDDVVLVERVRLEYRQALRARNGRLDLVAPAGSSVVVTGLSSPGARAWDVTDPLAPVELAPPVMASATADGYRATISLGAGKGARRVSVVEVGASRRPASLAPYSGAGLEAPPAGALIAIGPAELLAAAEPLLASRERDGLVVARVDVSQVFDRYAFGEPSAAAVRAYLSELARTGRAPAGVLVVGSASVDPRGFLGAGRTDRVPTHMVTSQVIETASDDWLADFDGDGIADLPIGRLPVRTRAEASALATRLAASPGPLAVGARPLVAFAAEAPQSLGGEKFAAASQALARALGSLARTVVHVAEPQDGARVRSALAQLWPEASIVSYLGHGSIDAWSEGLLTSANVAALTPGERAPVVLAMTCLNGHFQDPRERSLAEAFLLEGRASAVVAATGLPAFASQETFEREMLRRLLAGATLGAALRDAKRAQPDSDLRRTLLLFGDPTARLVEPATVPADPTPVAPSSDVASPRASGCAAAGPNAGGGAVLLVLVVLGAAFTRRRRAR